MMTLIIGCCIVCAALPAADCPQEQHLWQSLWVGSVSIYTCGACCNTASTASARPVNSHTYSLCTIVVLFYVTRFQQAVLHSTFHFLTSSIEL